MISINDKVTSTSNTPDLLLTFIIEVLYLVRGYETKHEIIFQSRSQAPLVQYYRLQVKTLDLAY